jgi:3-methyladenine DNA glycosylase AlkD
VVSTVALNLKSRGGRGDVPRTIDICTRVADDHDDMVVKGLSWALRELSKREKVPVRAFLNEHDDVLASRVKREVRRKLTTGKKS